MITALINSAQIVTVDTKGINYKRGSELKDINCVYDHSIIIEDSIIKDVIPASSYNPNTDHKKIDLRDKTILPGLIDCHTHTAFAGSRANEFRMKLSGVHYEEIAKAGGGINTTVKAVRASSEADLIQLMEPRINYFIAQGVTTLEIKSGYGLDFENEIKLLKAINYFRKNSHIKIIPTFLGAHTFPAESKDDHSSYISSVCNEMIPFISKNSLAVFCDGFCESTAFSSGEIDMIFSAAVEHGLKIKLHTEQFNNVGGIYVALKHNAVSIDHLEVIQEADIPKVSKTETANVLLPGVSFFLGYQYAPAKMLIDNNAIVALATDYNPGSSHIANINLIMSIAALNMKMTIEETISAVTINAAKALNENKTTGSIEIGKLADFAVFNTTDYADIIYNVGKNLNVMTIKRGRIIYDAVKN